jgi:hypothetical protein
LSPQQRLKRFSGGRMFTSIKVLLSVRSRIRPGAGE